MKQRIPADLFIDAPSANITTGNIHFLTVHTFKITADRKLRQDEFKSLTLERQELNIVWNNYTCDIFHPSYHELIRSTLPKKLRSAEVALELPVVTLLFMLEETTKSMNQRWPRVTPRVVQ